MLPAKSTDPEVFDPVFFTALTGKINLRPRKYLGWISPFAIFFNQLLQLTGPFKPEKSVGRKHMAP